MATINVTVGPQVEGLTIDEAQLQILFPDVDPDLLAGYLRDKCEEILQTAVMSRLAAVQSKQQEALAIRDQWLDQYVERTS